LASLRLMPSTVTVSITDMTSIDVPAAGNSGITQALESSIVDTTDQVVRYSSVWLDTTKESSTSIPVSLSQ